MIFDSIFAIFSPYLELVKKLLANFQTILEYVFARLYFRFPREENHESIVSSS